MRKQHHIDRPYWADAIATARKSANLTQEALGALIHKNRITVQKYEQGSIVPPFHVFFAIAQATGVSILDLMFAGIDIFELTDPPSFFKEAFAEFKHLFENTDIVFTDIPGSPIYVRVSDLLQCETHIFLKNELIHDYVIGKEIAYKEYLKVLNYESEHIISNRFKMLEKQNNEKK